MAVGIEHEGGVIIRVVMRAQPRRAIVRAARGYRGVIERVDGGAVLCRKGNMDAAVELAFAAEPEIRLAPHAQSRGGKSLLDLLVDFHDQAVAERGERFQVERLRARVVGYGNA